MLPVYRNQGSVDQGGDGPHSETAPNLQKTNQIFFDFWNVYLKVKAVNKTLECVLIFFKE